MQIVKMTKEDARELSILDKECFNVPWSEMSFKEEANNPIATYFLAKIDGKCLEIHFSFFFIKLSASF